MNPENPIDPRQVLEPSLTALLMGELPDDQARFIRQAIASDPELAKTFERLKKATELIQETEARPAAEPAAPPLAPKLSEARRQELLARFKTVQPPQFTRPSRSHSSRLLSLAAAIALMMVVAAALLPTLSRSKSRSMAQRRVLETDDLMRRKMITASESIGSRPMDRLAMAESSRSQSLFDKSASEAERQATETRSRSLAVKRVQQEIVLPSGDNRGLVTLSSDGAREAQDWGAKAQPQPSTTGVPQLNLENALGMFSYGESLVGIGGAAQSLAEKQVPVLGDVPLLGRRFSLTTKDSDRTESTEGDVTLQERPLQETSLAVGQPQQPKSDANSVGGGFGGGYLFTTAPDKANKRETLHSFLDTAANSSTPNLALGFESLTPAEASPSPELSSAFRKRDNRPDSESGQKLARAELSQAKEPASNPVSKNEVAKVAGQVEELKRQAGADFKEKALPSQIKAGVDLADVAAPKPASVASAPQPEIQSRDNAFSTFSLNVSDVSFKLAAASLERGVLPEPAGIRSEEFINAFDYRDPAPASGQPVGFAWDRAQYPFAQNRDVLRLSIKTAAAGRTRGQPLNLVLLLDNSGSMERADRVRIIHEALRVLATQLQAQDTFSVVTFARTARLWVDGVPGNQAPRIADELSGLIPEGGTNLEEAMNLAYQTASRHYTANGINRVVLLTDGAANLGDTEPEVLKKKVDANRKQGIAFDCFGIGWEGYNDDLLEVLTRNGDGRYGFLNTPEAAATEFASQLAGALHVAASDVKVQVEFNTNRVTAYRQIGYARHQLTKEQFRDNTVDAAEIGAAESGNALYVVETNPEGEGPLATIRVRYKLPGRAEYHEQEWTVPFTGPATPLAQASPALRLATTAASFSEWLANSPYAAEVTTDRLLGYLSGVPGVYGVDPRPQRLEWMIRQTKALSGK